MNKNKTGLAPAFPINSADGFPTLIANLTLDNYYANGISKRLYIACAAMSSMANGSRTANEIAERAFRIADCFLKQEIIDQKVAQEETND